MPVAFVHSQVSFHHTLSLKWTLFCISTSCGREEHARNVNNFDYSERLVPK